MSWANVSDLEHTININDQIWTFKVNITIKHIFSLLCHLYIEYCIYEMSIEYHCDYIPQ